MYPAPLAESEVNSHHRVTLSALTVIANLVVDVAVFVAFTLIHRAEVPEADVIVDPAIAPEKIIFLMTQFEPKLKELVPCAIVGLFAPRALVLLNVSYPIILIGFVVVEEALTTATNSPNV